LIFNELLNILTPAESGEVPFFGMQGLNNWRKSPVPRNSTRGEGLNPFYVHWENRPEPGERIFYLFEGSTEVGRLPNLKIEIP